MSYFASVNGIQIVAGSLVIPLVGAWTADLHLATAQQVTGQATVVIGNLTLVGNVFRSDPYGGQTRVRIVGGAGGWRKPISAQGYGTGGGVKLSTVLQDAAKACGETVSVASDTTIGNAYVRVAFDTSVAGDILWQMVAQGFIPAWYVDPAGTTQTKAWPSVTVNTPFTVTDQKPDEGAVEIATEDYAAWMPGASFSNPLLASGQTFQSSGVHYVWGNDGTFRLEVLTSSATEGADRVLGPIQQLVQKELAPARFYGRYAYTVSNPSDSTIDGTPVNKTLGLPDVQSVPIAADSVAKYAPPAGAACHIMFLDGVPTQPVCVWTDQAPTKVGLASGDQPVAKLGDIVQSVISGSITVLPGSTLAIAGTTPGTVTVTGTLVVAGTTPFSGTITTGSSVVGAPP